MSIRNFPSFIFGFAAITLFALEIHAQSTEPQAQPCLTASSDRKKEVLRIPKADSVQKENGDVVYLINGNESWRRTDLEVKRGQTIEISAEGIVRWAPDGIEQIDVGPDGTRPPYRDGWNYNHFPFPDAGIGSLVMRIGKGVYPVGSHRIVKTEDEGFVEFMINDDKLDDNSGHFTVEINRIEPEAKFRRIEKQML